MDACAFLAHVLPAKGPYCICMLIPGTRKFRNFAADTIEKAAEIAHRLDSAGKNAFFAVGTLKQARRLDPATGRVSVKRTGEDIKELQSHSFDVDVGEGRHYETMQAALSAIDGFILQTGLPYPTLINSGGGVHGYWPMFTPVPENVWEQKGKLLARLFAKYGVRIDSDRTTDSSTVLRVVGVRNHKYNPPRLVCALYVGKAVDQTSFYSKVDALLVAEEALGLGQSFIGSSQFGNNVDRPQEWPKLSLRKLYSNCAVFNHLTKPENQAQGKALISERLWMHVVQLTAHCNKAEYAVHLVSKFDPRYSKEDTDKKYHRIINKKIGPTTCAQFQTVAADPHNYNATILDLCQKCAHNGKIGSPAALAYYHAPADSVIKLQTTDIKVPEPPDNFIRTKDGIGVKKAIDGANIDEIFLPRYDMFPCKLQFSEETGIEERVGWMAYRPNEGWMPMDLPQGIPKNKLRSELARRGIYIEERAVGLTDLYMTLYMQKLQRDTARECEFSRLGWRKDGFVLGNVFYKSDGQRLVHSISPKLASDTGHGLRTEGNFDDWLKAIQIYNRPTLEAYRCYLYAAIGSIFYNMTGLTATFISASGVTGLGKTTLQEACASIWGCPEGLIVGGRKKASTQNGIEAKANAMHHLPLLLDDITTRDPAEMAEFIFGYSSGKGKLRSQASGGVRDDTASWANIALSSSNSDEYARIEAVAKEVAQHFMRIIQFDFTPNTVISKAEADVARRTFQTVFGHAGHRIAEYISTRYEELKARILKYIRDADAAINATSEERYWTATVAAIRLGGEIGRDLNLFLGFPVESDVRWMYGQLTRLRTKLSHTASTPEEIVSDYLNEMLPHTIVMSSMAGNISNTDKEPKGQLQVRVERDTGEIYVSNTSFKKYCLVEHVNHTRVITGLRISGVLLHESKLKTLGAGTPNSLGQVRCMVLDGKRLAGIPTLVAGPGKAPIAIGNRTVGGKK